MFKLDGLEKLSQMTTELKNFQEAVNHELIAVNFDPFDAQSIEMAIIESERIIDVKSEDFTDNDWVMAVANEMKSGVRQMIIDKASQSRIETEQRENNGDGFI